MNRNNNKLTQNQSPKEYTSRGVVLMVKHLMVEYKFNEGERKKAIHIRGSHVCQSENVILFL